ncbi:Crp/Fnr family transcriptional regulator [Niabella ginsenosidivorans]|uniref:Crp/Fnr family transcriptional regulator n=1 Tax=Niabella ginsenosidivorans TaxID=1176587 RepID=A0A1A9HXL1_9BACT|nr:Crp/Fnr family transcriptional regulator [Niabella ginsenosidivorans]ANH80158.1 Crp/Fnr family transcriptional regulator [Niabella ginsenosidivorans]
MFKNIIKNASKWIHLDSDEKELFINFLQPAFVPKKTVLLREGEICNFEAYIQRGCVRTYYVDQYKTEVTLQFAVEDWWVSDIASFHEHRPSKMFIETIEDCTLYMLSPKSKEELLRQIPKFERVFRMLVQRNLSTYQFRLFNMATQDTVDRYLNFISLYPTIPERVPQYHIASYLGVSPEMVSKARKKIAKRRTGRSQ